MNIFSNTFLKFLIGFLFVINFQQSVFADKFTSQFTEFELPNGWNCALEGSEWVCQSENKDRKKEAIIILAAKFRGEQDSLDVYQAYLKEPKSFQLPGGKSQVSEPKSLSVRKINDQQWVDALHLASEVPGFYTRYLATVKDNLGIAITFSVAKDHYDSYQEVFEKIIATLRVFDQQTSSEFQLANKKAEEVEVGSEIVDAESAKVDISQKQQKANTSSLADSDSLILIGGLVVIIILFLRIRKKKN